ncbi:hypothetical protein [Streptomyces sp. NPDC059979]|uniref:hypothetical protein n=1 Tax=Streptomyces sp. NPDC059979 TaxID=3347021 RepID=UPI0036C7B909
MAILPTLVGLGPADRRTLRDDLLEEVDRLAREGRFWLCPAGSRPGPQPGNPEPPSAQVHVNAPTVIRLFDLTEADPLLGVGLAAA